MATKPRRIVRMRTLPGEPTDGTGRLCIHLFVPDEKGPFVEPHALHPAMKMGEIVKGEVVAKPTRGRLACDPRKTVAPVTRGNVTYLTLRTDDPRAATCPNCLASADYAAAMKHYTPEPETAEA